MTEYMAMPASAKKWGYSDELEYFQYGECFQLAYEIFKLIGWTPAQVMSESWESRTDAYHCHVFVIHPDGSCVDIRGKSSLEDFKDRWKSYPYFHAFSEIEFEAEGRLWGDLLFPVGQDDFAKYWAKKIVRELNGLETARFI